MKKTTKKPKTNRQVAAYCMLQAINSAIAATNASDEELREAIAKVKGVSRIGPAGMRSIQEMMGKLADTKKYREFLRKVLGD